jgi:hypothetical protein
MTEEQVKVFKKIFQDFSGTLPNKVERNTSEMKYHLLADGVYWTDEGIRLLAKLKDVIICDEKNRQI